jgi:hypothetical protein
MSHSEHHSFYAGSKWCRLPDSQAVVASEQGNCNCVMAHLMAATLQLVPSHASFAMHLLSTTARLQPILTLAQGLH